MALSFQYWKHLRPGGRRFAASAQRVAQLSKAMTNPAISANNVFICFLPQAVNRDGGLCHL